MSKKIIFLNILYGIFFLFAWVVGAEQDPLSAKDAGKLTIAVANSNDKGALISQIREMITDHLNQKQRFALVDPEKLMAFLKEKPSIRQSDIIITKDITSKEAEAFEEMEEIMKSLHVDFFVIGGFTFKNYPPEITEKGEVVYKDSQSICIRLISASDHHLLSGRFYTEGTGKSWSRARQCQKSKISEAIIETTPIISQRMVASEELSKLVLARKDFGIKAREPRQEIAKIQREIDKKEKAMEESAAKSENIGSALFAGAVGHGKIAALKKKRKKFENKIDQMSRQVNWTRLDELEKDTYARLRKDLLERGIQKEVEKKIRSLAEDIDQKINISGPVISAEDEDRVKISIGKNHGLSSKSSLQAYVDQTSSYRVFGIETTLRTHKKLVTLETLEIEDDFCYAKVVKGKIKKLQKSLRKQNKKGKGKVRVRVVR